MAYTTIDKPQDYFNTKLYSGNSTDDTAITGVGFQPDLVWLRNRSITENHQWQDIVRGQSGGKYFFLQSNQTAADQVQSDNDGVKSLDSDGFTLGYTNSTGWNQSGSNYVTWNWLAQNGTSSNTDGSITSTVSANQTSGFSIVGTTGTGSAATIGHGLGAAPAMIIGKRRDSGSSDWRVYNKNLSSASHILFLNNSNAEQSGNSATWNNTAPTSSVFSVGTSGDVNASSGTFVFYCFAEIKGFSKFGKYTGNGSSDGAYINTGFKPAMMIIKKTSGVQEWGIYDNKRDSFNVADHRLFPNLSDSESTSTDMLDFTSNGFKCRTSNDMVNASGGEYIYMAYAENPFVTSTGIPGLAR